MLLLIGLLFQSLFLCGCIPVEADDVFVSTGSLGYEILENGTYLHMWNTLDDYYCNYQNGIQLSNFYRDQVWTQNILSFGFFEMVGGDLYGRWHELYRMDLASDYHEEITGVTNVYLNFTLWREMYLEGKWYNLTLTYHLGRDDGMLSIVSRLRNRESVINRRFAFGWIVSDIRVSGIREDNFIRFALLDNVTLRYSLHNSSLDERYSEARNEFWLERGDYFVRMSWLETQPYLLTVRATPLFYNANVTLFTVVGSISPAGKSTVFQWVDAGGPLGDLPVFVDLGLSVVVVSTLMGVVAVVLVVGVVMGLLVGFGEPSAVGDGGLESLLGVVLAVLIGAGILVFLVGKIGQIPI